MEAKNELHIHGQEQNFTFTAGGVPVPLDGASISIRFWMDGKARYSATTDGGEVKIGDDGNFSLQLSEYGIGESAGCDTYDVIAFIPGVGIVPVTKGPVR